MEKSVPNVIGPSGDKMNVEDHVFELDHLDYCFLCDKTINPQAWVVVDPKDNQIVHADCYVERESKKPVEKESSGRKLSE